MAAEGSPVVEESEKMEKKVAEADWNSLHKSFISTGDDDDEFSAFGSFSDLVHAQSAPAPDLKQESLVGLEQDGKVGAGVGNSLEKTGEVVDLFQKTSITEQETEVDFFTSVGQEAVGSQIDFFKQQTAGVDSVVTNGAQPQQINYQQRYEDPRYPGWIYNYQTGQWEQKQDHVQPQYNTQSSYGYDLQYTQNNYDYGQLKDSSQSTSVVSTPVVEENQNSASFANGHGFGSQTGYWNQQQYSGWSSANDNGFYHSRTQAYQTPGYRVNGHSSESLHANGPSTALQNQRIAHEEFRIATPPREEFRTPPREEYHDPFSVQSKFFETSAQHASRSPTQYQFGQPVQYVVAPPRTREEGLRSTAGRPPHAVTAFGFGGRLVVMKPKDPFMALEQARPLQVFQMSQLAGNILGYGNSGGPLAGNASMKDVMKWIDDRESKCVEDSSLHCMWGMLKICCQNYGNLRAINSVGKQDDSGPESALAKLLEPTRSEGSWAFGSRCFQPLPSEQQMQATAYEVKRLLIAGKQKEALRAAQEGQLWGPALLLARQLGEKFYTDAVAEMARRQFQPGFPLRTLTLLIAGHHAEVFAGNSSSTAPMSPQLGPDVAAQAIAEGMLDDWQENLAIMAANRTNGDETVIMHLGDCLWRNRNEVFGAHICYLVADAAFEPLSPAARLCLIGADHFKYPRTYASAEAIQRTEVYEYARVTGNSQYLLLPFQPYKLIYASMLAEAGKVNEALRYCQAVLKTLKTAGQAADVCKEVATSLEERLRIHTQGGSTSIVNRLFGNFGLHKMMPSRSRDNADGASISQRPSTASSSRSSTSMVPSASMEPISGIVGRTNMPIRSISEPDFSRPAQIDSPKRGGSKTPNKNVLSSFVQRALGLIRTPSKEAKLGEENKFRFDPQLNRWIEEGVDTPAEDLALAPPPITRTITRSEEDATPVTAVTTPERQQQQQQPVMSGIPPMPPSSNQYSARARQNVRSRYVDTFNKGNVTTTTGTSLLPPTMRASTGMAPAKFFVPAAVNTTTQPDDTAAPSGAFIPDFKQVETSETSLSGMNHHPTPALDVSFPAAPFTPAPSAVTFTPAVPLTTAIALPEVTEQGAENGGGAGAFGEDMQEVEL